MIAPPGPFEVSSRQVGGCLLTWFGGSVEEAPNSYADTAHVVAHVGIQVFGWCHQHSKSANVQNAPPGPFTLVSLTSHLLSAVQKEFTGAGCSQVLPPR